jgi:hypothetical protein
MVNNRAIHWKSPATTAISCYGAAQNTSRKLPRLYTDRLLSFPFSFANSPSAYRRPRMPKNLSGTSRQSYALSMAIKSALLLLPSRGCMSRVAEPQTDILTIRGLLTMDRIRDPPTAQDLKRHADHSSMRSTGKRVSCTPSTRRPSATSSTNCPYSQNRNWRIGLPPETSLLIPYLELRFRGPYVCGSHFEEPQVRILIRFWQPS